MNEKELRKHRCCFTGHRPEKLRLSEKELTKSLEREIKRAIDNNYTTFITGMAKGVDLIAAEIVLRLRKHDPRLKLICALPYPGFGLHWGKEWTDRVQQILDQSDLVQTICPSSSRAAYQARNKWMVQHSALVISVFNGERGGTKNTLDYAQKNNVPCVIIKG